MPDNKQIDDTLWYAMDTSPTEIGKLSPDIWRPTKDVWNIIGAAWLTVQEKSVDKLFQNFVWHMLDINISQAMKVPNEVFSVDKSKMKLIVWLVSLWVFLCHGKIDYNFVGYVAMQHLGTIHTLILACGVFKAAESLHSAPEALACKDNTTAQHQFVTEGGCTVRPNRATMLQVKIPGMGNILS